MSFLYPGFLFALLAIVIPVIIHLYNFRKFKKVYFSNVRFLKSIEQQTSSRQHIKNRLILLSRILAITFLVFAFAKPYIPVKNQSHAFGSNVVSIFIDNSFSMETLNKEGSLLDEAKRRAKEIVSAYGLNDKFQLLTTDFESKHQRLLSLEDFQNAVDEIKISTNSKNLDQIILRQKDIFLKEPNAKKTIYILSDFQKNILENFPPIKADSSVTIRLVRLKANALSNVSVDSVWFLSPIHKPGETEKLIVKLRNNSDVKAVGVPVKLTVNNHQKALGSLTSEPRASRMDTLSFSGLLAGWQQAQINITDYPVVFDDILYFSFYVQNSLPLLVINQSVENPYIQAVYHSDPFFKPVSMLAGNINYSQLSNYSFIILNEIDDISSGLIQQLKGYVQHGGTLTIFPSLNPDLTSLKNLLQALGTDIPESIITEETKVSSINLQHPVFKGVFERQSPKMDLPVAKKYIRYSNQSRSSKQSLLELPGGRSFFDEYLIGKGKIFLSAVPLEDEAGNFQQHSVFVPIMYQAALLSMRDQRLFYTLGEDQNIEIPKITLNANQTFKLRKEGFEAIPDVRQTENGTQLYVADQIKEKGNYQLLKADSVIAMAAFNNNGSESDLTYADDKELVSKFPNQKIDLFNTEQASLQNDIKSVNQGMQLWKICLILALLCLTAEILLIRFYKNFQPILSS